MWAVVLRGHQVLRQKRLKTLQPVLMRVAGRKWLETRMDTGCLLFLHCG
jgi:hypothetical protein